MIFEQEVSIFLKSPYGLFMTFIKIEFKISCHDDIMATRQLILHPILSKLFLLLNLENPQMKKCHFRGKKAILGQQFTLIILILVQKYTLSRCYLQKWLQNCKNKFFVKIRPKKCLWNTFAALWLIFWAIFKIPFSIDWFWIDAHCAKKSPS